MFILNIMEILKKLVLKIKKYTLNQYQNMQKKIM